MYKIVITKRAVKDIEKLTTDVKSQIGIKLNELKNNPFYNSRKLQNPIIGNYRFRVGDYRIIFDLDQDKIVILRIGHRKDIYR